MLTNKGIRKEARSIRVLKSLLNSKADLFHFIEEDDRVFFLPKKVLDDERCKAVHALVVELGGQWGGWNEGFMIHVSSLMNRIKEVKGIVVEKIAHPTEWYGDLVNDCREIIEGKNIGIMKRNHEIGKRVLTDILHFRKAEYGNKTIVNLAVDLGVSTTELYAYLKFAESYPDFNAFLRKFSDASENLSWRYVCKEVLVEKSKTDVPKKPANILEKMKSYYPSEMINQITLYVTEETSERKLRDIFKVFIKILWQLACEHEEIKRVALSRFEENIRN
ncbi:MAG: hypothetical protein OEZ40_09200 [Candidatus Bathyarchaeota archaeon]|nr:hypothetical protein [Candidatus Bathyarchaeota archaeon]